MEDHFKEETLFTDPPGNASHVTGPFNTNLEMETTIFDNF